MPAKHAGQDPTRVEFVYFYDRNDSPAGEKAAVDVRRLPTTPDEAAEELFASNGLYAGFIAECRRPLARGGSAGHQRVCVQLTPREVGADSNPFPEFPKQKPFGAFLGCVDARAPVEIVFAQGFDDLYTFRIAGNTLGPDCAASLHYALHKLAPLAGTPCEKLPDRTLRLVVALGHADCGAVTAAVDTVLGKDIDLSKNDSAFLVEDSVRGLLGRIHFPAVNLAVKALPAKSFGETEDDARLRRLALIELSVYLNAAWSGHDMRDIVEEYDFADGTDVQVRYGVFDPRDCYVRTAEAYRFAKGGTSLVAPRSAGEALNAPPCDLEGLYRLAQTMAAELLRQHRSDAGKQSLEKFFRVS